MKCTFSKAMLALHVEGDLPSASAERTSSHLAECDECRRFVDELAARLSLLKALRSETVSPSQCTGMRRDVMDVINRRADSGGWALRFERALILGFQRRSYAAATAAVVCLVSVAVLAQMRHEPQISKAVVPAFDDRDTLVRPEGYRDWVLVAPADTRARKVFIDPTAYRRYEETGKFPEGTLMIWEPARDAKSPSEAHGNSATLLASVKDTSRFEGGWGFFDFTAADGTVAPKAKALPESRNCRTCHRKGAETDHVFTQFYPVLRSARHAPPPPVVQRRNASLANT